jgi:aspartate ammonia-lyase
VIYRTERDSLGDRQVPAAAYYGVETERAIENFPISGLHAPADLVTATVLIKKASAGRGPHHAGDRDRMRELLDRSTAVATALSPHLGYDVTAEIAKEAVRTGKSIRDIVLERGLLDAGRLDRILSPEAMTESEGR